MAHDQGPASASAAPSRNANPASQEERPPVARRLQVELDVWSARSGSLEARAQLAPPVADLTKQLVGPKFVAVGTSGLRE
jgi:hypothetical protein